MNETVEIANLLATLLPLGLNLYDRIQKNNQDAGLEPLASILDRTGVTAQKIVDTATAELASLPDPPLTPPDAPQG